MVFTGDLSNPNVKELLQRDDPRIWIIGGEFGPEKLHYFSAIIEQLLPDLPETRRGDNENHSQASKVTTLEDTQDIFEKSNV